MKLKYKILLWMFLTGVVLALILAIVGYWYYLDLSKDLPEVDELKTVEYQVPMKVLSSSGSLITEFGEKRRVPLPADQIPILARQAVISAEDDSFYEHAGIDYKGLMRAAWAVLTSGERSQGGSTLTMQVARNFFLTREKTYTRKIREIILARKIEEKLSKDEILALYLNQNFMGNRAYGFAAAANTYYGKDVTELSLAQIAMLAGLYKAPSAYNPVVNPSRALERRNYVIRRMRENGHIDVEQEELAKAEPLTARVYVTRPETTAYYVAEMVRDELIKRLGDDIYVDGLSVITTIDDDLQYAANNAVQDSLIDYTIRHGYQGADGKFEFSGEFDNKAADSELKNHASYGDLVPAIVKHVEDSWAELYVGGDLTINLDLAGVSWAKERLNEDELGPAITSIKDVLAPGDVVRVQEKSTGWVLSQIPRVGGALVSISPIDGRIYALNGGYNFFYSKFNRAIQAERQPGSNFKPFIYSAALANGLTPASTFNDAPVVFKDEELGRFWRPENYSGKFFGPTRLRVALAKSRNMVSIRLLQRVGIDETIAHVKSFKMAERALPRDLSLSLGSASHTPLEIVNGYAVFANGGFKVQPWFIDEVRDRDGNVIYKHVPSVVCEEETCARLVSDPAQAAGQRVLGTPAERVLDEVNAFQVTSMLQDVIRIGTATALRDLGRSDLAGKTGTTNDQVDGWFSGYNQDFATTVWVGFDNPRPLGKKETGGKVALPIWKDYMRVALQRSQQRPWPMPEVMVAVTIDQETGLQAMEEAPNTVVEYFSEENVPEMGLNAYLPPSEFGEEVVQESMPEDIF